MKELSEYGPIIEAETIPFSFEAPGWHILFWSILSLSFIFILLLAVRYIKRKNRRIAIKHIQSLANSKNRNQNIHRINTSLKLLAINFYGREKVASLYGYDWLNFLNKTCKKSYFNMGESQFIFEAAYDSKLTINDNLWQAFIKSSTQWIKHYGI